MEAKQFNPAFDRPETKLATRHLSRVLGTHLVTDERVNEIEISTDKGWGPVMRVSETVLYTVLEGTFKVSSITHQNRGNSWLPGVGETVAEVRIVEGDSIAEAKEIGAPRVRIIKSARQLGTGFEMEIAGGWVENPYALTEAMRIATELVEQLADR